jgi:hypothetical protein
MMFVPAWLAGLRPVLKPLKGRDYVVHLPGCQWRLDSQLGGNYSYHHGGEHRNLVIEHLRAIRGDLAEFKADIIEIKTRIGHMEGLYANLSARVDRLSGDIQHIKRRLDLVDV